VAATLFEDLPILRKFLAGISFFIIWAFLVRGLTSLPLQKLQLQDLKL